jgi:histone H3/H4
MARKKPSPRSSDRRNRSIPRATFLRLIKEISNDFSYEPLNWAEDAVDGLHEYAEAYLQRQFSRATQLLDTFEQKTLDLRHFRSAAEVAA